MCECGVVPVIRRLLKKGLPVSCAVTYLLASPVVNPIVAASTFAAFRGNQPGLTTVFRPRAELLCIAALVGLVRAAAARSSNSSIARVLETLPGSRSRRTAGFRVGSLAGVGSLGGAAVSPFTHEGTEAGAEALETLDALAGEPASRASGAACWPPCSAGANDFLDVAVFVVIGAALSSVFNTAVDPAAHHRAAGDESLGWPRRHADGPGVPRGGVQHVGCVHRGVADGVSVPGAGWRSWSSGRCST